MVCDKSCNLGEVQEIGTAYQMNNFICSLKEHQCSSSIKWHKIQSLRTVALKDEHVDLCKWVTIVFRAVIHRPQTNNSVHYVLSCFGLAWPGLAWSGLVWSLLPWHSLIWSGLIWFYFYLFLKQSLPVTGLPLVSCLTFPSAGISGTDHHIWFANIF